MRPIRPLCALDNSEAMIIHATPTIHRMNAMENKNGRKLGDHQNHRPIQIMDESKVRARAMASVSLDEIKTTVRLVAAAGRLTLPGRRQ
jgi:hypothetical protein